MKKTGLGFRAPPSRAEGLRELTRNELDGREPSNAKPSLSIFSGPYSQERRIMSPLLMQELLLPPSLLQAGVREYLYIYISAFEWVWEKSANFLLRFEVYVGFRLHALVLTTVEPVICGRALFVSLAPKCWRWGSAFLRS